MQITITPKAAGKKAAAKKRGAKSAVRARSAPARGGLTIACSLPIPTGGKAALGPPRYQRSLLNLADQPDLTATILDSIGIALLNRGSLAEGGTLIEQARDIRLKHYGATHPATALSYLSIARLERERGNYKAAQLAVNDALTVNQAVYGPQSLPVAISLNEQGAVQLKQGNFAAAEKSAAGGLTILTTLGINQVDPNTTRLLDVRGRAEAALGKATDADATYKQLLALDATQLGTTKHPKYATHVANSGLAKAALGQFPAAKSAFQTAINLYEGMGLFYHPNLIDSYANLGTALRVPGATSANLKLAGELLNKALARSTAIRGKDHVLVGNDHANLGRWLYATGDKKKAAAAFATALKIYNSNVSSGDLPAGHFFIAEALTWQGRALVESDDAVAAQTALSIAITAWPAGLAASKLGTAIAEVCLGRALYLQNPTNPQACQHLCAGYKIVTSGLPDPVFVQTVRNWCTQQGCPCC